MNALAPQARPTSIWSSPENRAAASLVVTAGGILILAFVLIWRIFAASSDFTDDDAQALREKVLARLEIKSSPAGTSALLSGSARPYVEARRALSKGQPTQALEHLVHNHGSLFADRESLVRGQALLALGQTQEAIESFEQALNQAVLPSIAENAVEGLATAYQRLEQLRRANVYLDTLVEHRGRRSPNPRWLLSKAEIQAASGAHQEALNLASTIITKYGSSRQVAAARSLEAEMVEKGAERVIPFEELILTQADTLRRQRKYNEATVLLNKLEPNNPEAKFLRARMLSSRGKHEDAERIYEQLTEPEVPDDIAAEALYLLARRQLKIDDNDAAQRIFERLMERAPRDSKARIAEFKAGWIDHDADRFDAATKRMVRYAERHRRASDRDEALWFAGWSQYLAKNYDAAEQHLKRILKEHSRSSMVPQTYYWLGRIHQQRNEAEKAKAAYQRILLITPMTYYAVWAKLRLAQYGEPPPAVTPPKTLETPSSLERALTVLGPARPTTIDRAILLHSEDRPGEVHRELSAALESLRPSEDLKRAQIAELLNHLGAHNLGLRTVQKILGSGRDLEQEDLTAWIAWRQAYPKAYPKEVEKAQTQHEISPEFIWSIMRTESHYRPTLRSRAGALGLMQLMPATARRIGKTAKGGQKYAARYRKPNSNIWLGAWYLGALLKRYGGQIAPAAGGYNAGPRAMDRWLQAFDGLPLDEFIERIPYRETRRYVRRVIENWAIYLLIYKGELLVLPRTIQKKISPKSKANF